jgi:hypothetical protein
MRNWSIKTKEFKKYNHKTIYIGKFSMTTYMQVPKSIQFDNVMVNDMNQNLCGGWSIFENGFDEDKFLLSRVINKEKPFGVISYWKEHIDEINNCVEIIKNNNLPYELISRPDEKLNHIYVCQNGIMCDLFDLDCLFEDYFENDIYINIEKVRNKELKEYFNGWDRYKNGVQPWGTGLILGYPIENTISLYLEGRV